MDQLTALNAADRASREVLPKMLLTHFPANEDVARCAARISSSAKVSDRSSAAEMRKHLGLCKRIVGRLLGCVIGETKPASEFAKNRPAWLSYPAARAIWCASESVRLSMLDIGGDDSPIDALSAACDYARLVLAEVQCTS